MNCASDLSPVDLSLMYVIWTVLWEVTWELLWGKKPQIKFVLKSVVSQVTVCDVCVER